MLAGRRPVLELLRAGRSAERIFVAREIAASRLIGEIKSRARNAAIPVRVVPRKEIESLAGGLNHQGVIALTARFRYAALEQLVAGAEPRVLFLDGLTDPHNIGSLLRSADGAGFTGVVLPAHRSPGVTATVRRVSAGAAEVVPVARVSSLANAVEVARGAGLWIVGLNEAAEEDIWSSRLMEPPVGIVLGAEDRGISKGVTGRCDAHVRIPVTGALQSLNAATAGAIAMFEVARRGASGFAGGKSLPSGVAASELASPLRGSSATLPGDVPATGTGRTGDSGSE